MKALIERLGVLPETRFQLSDRRAAAKRTEIEVRPLS